MQDFGGKKKKKAVLKLVELSHVFKNLKPSSIRFTCNFVTRNQLSIVGGFTVMISKITEPESLGAAKSKL